MISAVELRALQEQYRRTVLDSLIEQDLALLDRRLHALIPTDATFTDWTPSLRDLREDERAAYWTRLSNTLACKTYKVSEITEPEGPDSFGPSAPMPTVGLRISW